jgi:hypothetical protein
MVFYHFDFMFFAPQLSTSKSGPNYACFLHFVFEMCFAPSRHNGVQARIFSTSQLPKVRM